MLPYCAEPRLQGAECRPYPVPSSYVPSPGRQQGRRAATQVDKRRRRLQRVKRMRTRARPVPCLSVRSFVRSSVSRSVRPCETATTSRRVGSLGRQAGRAVDLRYVQLYVILPHSTLAWRPAAHSKPSNSRCAGLVLTDRPRPLGGRVVSIRRTAAMRAGRARLAVKSG